MSVLVPINLAQAHQLLADLQPGQVLDLSEEATGFVGIALLQRLMAEGGLPAVESFMLTLPQQSTAVLHHFGPGLYWREVTFPAGVVALGHAQRQAHTNVMLTGRVTLVGEDGDLVELVAPMTSVGQPGRKAGMIHKATTWLNFYPNSDDEQDVDVLEGRWIDQTPQARAAVEAQRMGRPVSSHQVGYWLMRSALGLNEDQVQAEVNRPDLIPLPWGAYAFKVARSPIHGRGLFATAPIAAGTVIAPARIGSGRTVAGRFTNHGAVPNAQLVARPGGDLDLVAVQDIAGARGGFDGDEILIDYRAAYQTARESL